MATCNLLSSRNIQALSVEIRVKSNLKGPHPNFISWQCGSNTNGHFINLTNNKMYKLIIFVFFCTIYISSPAQVEVRREYSKQWYEHATFYQVTNQSDLVTRKC